MDDNRKLAREVFLALEDSVDSMRIDIDRIAAYGEARYKAGYETRLHYVNESIFQRKRAEAAYKRIKELEGLVRELRKALLDVYSSIPGTYDESGPMVRCHAKALNAIPAILARADKAFAGEPGDGGEIALPKGLSMKGIAVAVSGPYRGWVFVKHADGQWVTASLLDDFSIGILDAALYPEKPQEGKP